MIGNPLSPTKSRAAKFAGTLHVDHVGLALRRFGLADVRIRQRECRRRAREHAEHQAREILLGLHQARAQLRLLLPAGGAGMPGRGGGGDRARDQDQRIGDEARRDGPASCAGNSSRREYLSGSSAWISNSIGTRFSPRTCRVRPLAMNVLTAGDLRLAAERGAGRGHDAVGRASLRKARHLIGTETNQDNCDSADNRDESAHRRRLLRRTGYLDPRKPETVVELKFQRRITGFEGFEFQTKKAARTFTRAAQRSYERPSERFVERPLNVRRALPFEGSEQPIDLRLCQPTRAAGEHGFLADRAAHHRRPDHLAVEQQRDRFVRLLGRQRRHLLRAIVGHDDGDRGTAVEDPRFSALDVRRRETRRRRDPDRIAARRRHLLPAGTALDAAARTSNGLWPFKNPASNVTIVPMITNDFAFIYTSPETN